MGKERFKRVKLEDNGFVERRVVPSDKAGAGGLYRYHRPLAG